MSGFIFPSSSYALGYRLSDELTGVLTAKLKDVGVRFINVNTVDEFKATFGKIKYFVTAYLNCSSSSELDDLRAEFKDSYHLLHVHTDEKVEPKSTNELWHGDSFDKVEQGVLIDQSLSFLVPKRFDELAEFCAGFIFPSLFSQFETSFHKEDATELDDYHIQIMCDISSSSFKGRGWVRVNLDALRAKSEELKGMSDELIIDNCREFVNQFLGVINSNLMNLGYSASIGLPTVVTKAEVANIRRSGPYIPTVTLNDKEKIFSIKIGLVLIENAEMLDLSDLTFESPDDEVDFF